MIKEKVNNLIAAYCAKFGSDEENISFLEDRFDSFRTYVNAVASMEYKIPILRFRLEGDEFRDAVMELDRYRKVCHDDVISTCSFFNRVSANLGLQPFYEGNIEDRHQVAEFAGDFVNELYQRGISPTREYDSTRPTIVEHKNIVLDDVFEQEER